MALGFFFFFRLFLCSGWCFLPPFPVHDSRDNSINYSFQRTWKKRFGVKKVIDEQSLALSFVCNLFNLARKAWNYAIFLGNCAVK